MVSTSTITNINKSKGKAHPDGGKANVNRQNDDKCYFALKNFLLALLLAISFMDMACYGRNHWQDYRPLAHEKGEEFQIAENCRGFAKNDRGHAIFWRREFPLRVSMNNSIPEKMRGQILMALSYWNEGLGFQAFDVLEEMDGSSRPLEDGMNVIYWVTSWPIEEKELQASTLVHWSEDGINDADIILNADDFKISVAAKEGEIDLSSLVIHELGHVLGLNHINETDSVMVPRLALGEKRRTPSKQDIDNLLCLYGSKRTK